MSCPCVSSIHVEALQRMRQTPNPTPAPASGVPGDCGCGGCGCGCTAPTMTLTFFVSGMTCASCAQRLSAALARVKGVRDARVSFLSRQADIVVDTAQSGPAAVAAADCVTRLGYTMLGGDQGWPAVDVDVYGGAGLADGRCGVPMGSVAAPGAGAVLEMAREGSRLFDTASLMPLTSNDDEEMDSLEEEDGTSGGDHRARAGRGGACTPPPATLAPTSPPAAGSSSPSARTRLLIEGMSCASCAARIERQLLRLAGVQEATVNFAVMSGRVLHDTSVVSAADLVATVRGLGYSVSLQGSQPVLGLVHGARGGARRLATAKALPTTTATTTTTPTHASRGAPGEGHGHTPRSALGRRPPHLAPESGISILIDNDNDTGMALTPAADPAHRGGLGGDPARSCPSTGLPRYVHRFLIEGMSCESCAARVEREVRALPTVTDAVVSFSTGTAAVTTSDDFASDHAAVRDRIASMGYHVRVLRDRARRGWDGPRARYDATCSREGGDDEEEGLARDGEVGNDDVAVEGDVGRTRAALERTEEIRVRWSGFVNSAILSVPLAMAMLIMAFTDLMETDVAFALVVDGVQLVCATPIVLVFGRQFFTGAWRSLQHGAFTMDTLVAIGTGCSYLYSAIVFAASLVSGVHIMTYFDTAGMLTTFMLLGRYLEASAKRHTSGALIELMSLVPAMATVVTPDGDVRVASAALQVGDQVRVLAGDRVPVDGTIVGGLSDIDEQLVTGESVPKPCGPGDRVVGGTLNVTASLLVEVDRVGEDTLLSHILRIVQDAQSTKPAVQRIADRVAMYFVPFVLVSSLLTLAVWLVLGAMDAYPAWWRPHGMSSTAFAFNFFIATVVAACPCALGLATPTAIMVGTGVGAQHGVLVKSGVTLESVRETDCIVFDKTGTITNGELRVTWSRCFHVADGPASELVERLVGAVESQSTHPIAKAIAAELQRPRPEASARTQPTAHARHDGCASVDEGESCTTDGVTSHVDVLESVTHPGRGLEATVAVTETRADGQYVQQYRLLVGSLLLLEERAAVVSREVADAVRQCHSRGETTLVAAVDGVAVLVAALTDEPKGEAFAVMAHLHRRHIRTLMVTGDNSRVAAAVARRVGISFDSVRAEVLPAGKAEIVKELQAEGHRVMFVGDGINDSPALAQADVGVALGAGTEVAIDAADAVLMRNSLVDLLNLHRLSHVTVRRIYGNFVWAFAYNLIMLPLASGLLYPVLPVQLPPVVAGAAMVMSSLSVLASSLSIRCFRPYTQAEVARSSANVG